MNLIDKAIALHRLKNSWLGDGGVPVDLELAQKRADTCNRGDGGKPCPNNQEKPIYEMFAGAAAKTVLRQLQLKDEMRLRVRGEECLHVCSGCGCILRLKIHVPFRFISESGIPDGLPSFCWQVTENNNHHDNDNTNSGLPK